MKLKVHRQQKEYPHPHLLAAELIVGSIFFLIPNIFFIVQGFFVRYWADDYCFSGLIREFGFTRGLVEFYSATSNRFSAFVFAGFSELFGDHTIRVISPLIIIFFGFMLYKTFDQLISKYHIEQSKKIPVLFSLILLFFILYLAPNIHQSVYWRSGLTHYFLPIPILLYLFLVIFSTTKTEKKNINKEVFLILASFFSAGLSESAAALQMGSFGIALLCTVFIDKSNYRKRRYRLLGTALLGTAVAMGVMIISPGNALRLDTLQQASNLFSIVSISAASAINFISLSIRGLWLPFGVLYGSFVLITYCFISPLDYEIQLKVLLSSLFLIALVAFVLVVCVCAPTAYGMMAYPEQRVLMLAQFVLISGISMEGIITGLVLQKISYFNHPFCTVSLFLILVLDIYPLTTLDVRKSDLRYYINRAALWDARDMEIISQIGKKKSNLSVTALDSFAEIAELRGDAGYWVNHCAAEYYKVESISAEEK
ncbi:MAG: hypothetical protein J7K66_00675 [Anaerolineaceae bacterium]|nr:hypothetical protein [Anaerolineaceae bacterium]